MVALARLFDWKNVLIVVKPDTLVRWHRKGFRLFWRWKSRRKGRPPVPEELKKLIVEMAIANVSWGEERIAHELLVKLGIRVSPRTVRKYIPSPDDSHRGDRDSSQRLVHIRSQSCEGDHRRRLLNRCHGAVPIPLRLRRDGSRYAQDSPRERDHASDRGVDLAAVPRSDTVRARLSLRDRGPRYQVLRRFTEVRASDGRQGVEDAPIRVASEWLLRETDRHHPPPRVFGLPHPAVGEAPASAVVRMA